jgi:hypothetical protein
MDRARLHRVAAIAVAEAAAMVEHIAEQVAAHTGLWQARELLGGAAVG